MRFTFGRCTIIASLILLMFTSCAWCSDSGSSTPFASAVSGTVLPFMVAGELYLYPHGKLGRYQAFQGAKALLVTGFATQALKFAVREKRPNSDSRSSFPSGHTSAAFAMATVLAEYHPELKWEVYSLATAIGVSRVAAGEHHWQDVAAGAVLGHFVAKYFTNEHVHVSADGVSYQWKF